VARAVGRGDHSEASRLGIQSLILAAAIGVGVTSVGVAFAGGIVGMFGGSASVSAYAEPYLRIRSLSSIPVLLVQAGNGYFRGYQDTRTPLYILTAGAALHVVADWLLIYPAGLGVDGAAWATVIGQSVAAAAFVWVQVRRMRGARWRPDPAVMRSLLVIGGDLAVRTGALLAAMTIATSVAARMGNVELGAWQVAQQVFLFLALLLDSVAIAAQALVGRYLGAASPARAAEISRRLMTWGVALGLLLLVFVGTLASPLSHLFSGSEHVVVASIPLLLWVAAVQPLSSAAFTLDGILIGASDTRFLAGSMVLSSLLYAAVAVLSLRAGWGTAGLAAGATIWMIARTATTGARFWGGRWAFRP
jgi:putative MATE family efflux protein